MRSIATSTPQFSFTIQHRGFLKNAFPLNLPEGWTFSKVKITDIAISLLNLAETKFYEVGLAPLCQFVFSFPNFKSRALSRDTSGGRLMSRAEVRVRAQAFHGNVTVLIHLKQVVLRRNPIENRAISVLVDKNLYQSNFKYFAVILHFLKAKYIKN